MCALVGLQRLLRRELLIAFGASVLESSWILDTGNFGAWPVVWMRSEVPFQECWAPINLVAVTAVLFKVTVVGVVAPTIAAGILRGMRDFSSVFYVLCNCGEGDFAVRAIAVVCFCLVIVYNLQTSETLAAKRALWMLASFMAVSFPFGRKGELTEAACPLSGGGRCRHGTGVAQRSEVRRW